MDMLERETIKKLLTNYIRNTEDESEIVEGLSRILADGQILHLEEARRLVQGALNETIEEIIVTHSDLDGSHPSVDSAIEMCFESHVDDFVENILTKLEGKGKIRFLR